MDDEKIIELYWERSEDAIRETQEKYGKYCGYIANHILNNLQDAEECVNDTYVGAWNTIPPQRPSKLKQFLGCLTRNIALNRLDYNTALKRGEVALALDELSECVADTGASAENELFLRETINGFLASLEEKSRIVFIQRYWYLCSVKEIAKNLDMSEANVKVTLHRTRNKLKAYLEREGEIL